MKLIYKKISREYYNDNKSNISKLIEYIWQKHIDDVEMAKKAIERSFTTEKWSFYYIIEKDWKDIGLTWYYTIDDNTKIFGLNHHWILKKYR